MSWEKMSESQIKCPCGKGRIYQEHYMDDWNRYKDSGAIIDCPECSKKYKIEAEHHTSYKPYHGDWDVFYLTPIDYPAYTGFRAASLYGGRKNIFSCEFETYLIENYTDTELNEVASQLASVTSSAKLSGMAKRVREDHKLKFKTVKIQLIRERVSKANLRYNFVSGNKVQRMEAEEREQVEYNAYMEEKRKYQIRLDL